MILVDASVIFDHTRNFDTRLETWFRQFPTAICGVTRLEALHGARGPKDRAKLLLLLNRFIRVLTPESIWDEAGDNLARLRGKGLTIPPLDVLLATFGIHYDIEVWARDQHFPLMQKHLPRLRLFQEPP